ncbi:hypothetical protein EPI10_030452 [Gossypium australe]|uniref:Uncharacterized protein n=1 Tax=Gossypium australe TaxID=47621 RepID=A0A5B6WYQ1_9ROSI|nr:hypothetical protein EPI10_030452 [Gossypium australe]
MVIISPLRGNEVGAQVAPRVIIQKHVAFSYKDSKGVPWNYDYNDIGFYTHSGRRYGPTNARIEPIKRRTLAVEHKKEKTARPESPINELVTKNEAKEFLKFMKHSEYSVVELLHKQPARISVLALLLSSETHHSALMKVLNETYAADEYL